MWFEDRPPPQWLPHTLADGREVSVPELVVRHEAPAQPGWQLRFGEWTLYPDHAGPDGAIAALADAISEMHDRIAYRGK